MYRLRKSRSIVRVLKITFLIHFCEAPTYTQPREYTPHNHALHTLIKDTNETDPIQDVSIQTNARNFLSEFTFFCKWHLLHNILLHTAKYSSPLQQKALHHA